MIRASRLACLAALAAGCAKGPTSPAPSPAVPSRAAEVDVPVHPAADDLDRLSPPSPGSRAVFTPPVPTDVRVPSGARALVVTRRTLPIVHLTFRLRFEDDVPAPSTAWLAGRLLSSRGPDGSTLRERLSAMGVTFHGASQDAYCEIGVGALPSQVPEVVDVVVGMMRQSRLDATDFASGRDAEAKALSSMSPRERLWKGLQVGFLPARHRLSGGSVDVLAKLRIEDVQRYRDRVFADRLTLVAIGDVEAGVVREALGKATSAWKAPPRRTPLALGEGAVVVPAPAAEMAEVMVAAPVPLWRSDYAAVLGLRWMLAPANGLRARLEERKVDRWEQSYANVMDRGDQGYVVFAARVPHGLVAQTVQATFDQWAEIQRTGMPARTLREERAELVEWLAGHIDGHEALSGVLGVLLRAGAEPDAHATAHGAAITLESEAVRTAAATYLDPKKARVVVVGKPDEAALRALGLGVRTIAVPGGEGSGS